MCFYSYLQWTQLYFCLSVSLVSFTVISFVLFLFLHCLFHRLFQTHFAWTKQTTRKKNYVAVSHLILISVSLRIQRSAYQNDTTVGINTETDLFKNVLIVWMCTKHVTEHSFFYLDQLFLHFLILFSVVSYLFLFRSLPNLYLFFSCDNFYFVLSACNNKKSN